VERGTASEVEIWVWKSHGTKVAGPKGKLHKKNVIILLNLEII
jgi:hypothetical protein